MNWEIKITTRPDSVSIVLWRSDIKMPARGEEPPDGSKFVIRTETNLESDQAATEAEMLARALARLAHEVAGYAVRSKP